MVNNGLIPSIDNIFSLTWHVHTDFYLWRIIMKMYIEYLLEKFVFYWCKYASTKYSNRIYYIRLKSDHRNCGDVLIWLNLLNWIINNNFQTSWSIMSFYPPMKTSSKSHSKHKHTHTHTQILIYGSILWKRHIEYVLEICV